MSIPAIQGDESTLVPMVCADLYWDLRYMVEDSKKLSEPQLKILADMMDPLASSDFVPGVAGWLSFHYHVTKVLNRNRKFLPKEHEQVPSPQNLDQQSFANWVQESHRLAINAEELKKRTKMYGRDTDVQNMEGE